VFSKADYVFADQLENLARFFMNPKLADPACDAEDLIGGYVRNIGVAGGFNGYLPGPTGSLFGLPFGSETSVLAYRTDIFEKHGLKVPETYDELLALACRIPELEPGMGGLATRAASGHQAAHAFLLHLNPPGGAIFDDAWNPVVNNAQGVAAAAALKRIVDCGPEGSSAFGPAEAANAFAQGQAAMFLDSIAFAPTFQDDSRSKVVGKVGYAMHPMGVRRGSQTGGFGLAIPRNAENPDAAFLLMQWLTSKQADLMIAMEGGNPSRFSTYANAELNAKHPYAATFGEALKYADPDWRPITDLGEHKRRSRRHAVADPDPGAGHPDRAGRRRSAHPRHHGRRRLLHLVAVTPHAEARAARRRPYTTRRRAPRAAS